MYVPLPLGGSFASAPAFHHMVDEDDALTIFIGDVARVTHTLTFDTYLAYRKIPESYANRLINDLSRCTSSGHHFLSSSGSDLKEWFLKQADVLADGLHVETYTIAFSNEIVEVLSEEPPRLQPV